MYIRLMRCCFLFLLLAVAYSNGWSLFGNDKSIKILKEVSYENIIIQELQEVIDMETAEEKKRLAKMSPEIPLKKQHLGASMFSPTQWFNLVTGKELVMHDIRGTPHYLAIKHCVEIATKAGYDAIPDLTAMALMTALGALNIYLGPVMIPAAIVGKHLGMQAGKMIQEAIDLWLEKEIIAKNGGKKQEL